MPNPHPTADPDAAIILGEGDYSLVAVRAVLEAKGFGFMVLGVPDFLIGVRAEMTGERGTNIGKSPIIGPWDDTAKIKDRLIEGTHVMNVEGVAASMHVEVFDAKTKEIVWTGWASSSSLNAFRGDNAKLKIVNQIMQRFPN